jgi:polar amino acid transport system substrate-binding protein
MKKLVLPLIFLLIVISASETFSQKHLNEIANRGELRVGMSGNQPPYNMEAKDGTLMGFEVDLAELLAESMNVELKLVRKPFKDLLSALDKGEVDMVMSGMTITMERNLKTAFIGPYMLSGKSILTTSQNLMNAKEMDDLNQSQLKITTLNGSTSQKMVETILPEATSIPSSNYEESVDRLLNGEANVMLADYAICALTMLRNPDKNLVTLTEPLTLEPIGMALPADDPLLLNFMNNYFNALMMAGALDELEAFWFNNGSWLLNMK